MLKVLIKKELGEVFRSYFYDAKKNRMRSKLAVAAWFFFFVAIMAGLLGGMFTFLSLTLCEGLTGAGMGWLYFMMMSGIAILLGTFGSVFNTYSSLYLAKDNDLLLSLPIPVRTIITARLTNVYLMGTMYAATVMIPVIAVYLITAGFTPARLICGLLLFLIVTVIVMLLSCLLGWVVARLSLKFKNRSFVTVIISLLFIGGYYFFYFKANGLIRDILMNAQVYGEKIKGAAYGLFLFGRIGEGDWAAAGIFTAVTAGLFILVWTMLQRSFLKIATADPGTQKVRYKKKTLRQKSVFAALLGKEFARFTSSANYMLNCGLGVLLITASGVMLLLKGRAAWDILNEVFRAPDKVVVLLCAMLCALCSMNDMAAPSVSLEGKSLWIPQSLPLSPGTVLRAKACVQLILTGLPMLFASVSAAIIVKTSLPVKILAALLPLVYAAFSAVADTALGIRMPLLNWTNEIAPIKQSGAVAIAMFGSWAVCVAVGGLYLLIGYKIGAAPYLLCWTVLFAAGALIGLRWLDTGGAKSFRTL